MSPLWISKVEDFNSNEQKDSVQVNNQLSNQNYLRSAMTVARRPMRTINLSELTRESAAFVTFSKTSMNRATTYATTLSGVDETLFSAD